MKIVFLLMLATSPLLAQKFTQQEMAQWKMQSSRVSIVRDTWGIPHISGKSDANAVFGMLYAECEDDFNRVERNYIKAVARLAEAEGEEYIFDDLRTRLFYDTVRAIQLYAASPDWMKKICSAFADGINYYLFTHPQVKPKLLTRFKPWMPLLFSEGSIGGDIERVSLNELKAFYNEPAKSREGSVGDGLNDERGSNGFAIAPFRSATGNALLLINPHVSFYFRSEIHVKSEEGLNAYGATTWGQFFVYQGFNEHCGWMHTSSKVDVIDEYTETITKNGDNISYLYDGTLKPIPAEKVTIAYKTGKTIAKREFTVYHTHHGPVVAQRNGKWISVRLMQEPLKALTQSFQRTKSATFDDFENSMVLRTNSSNNTVYADDKGNIAYWHGNFIPRRDLKFDWSVPVDGSDPATEWKDLHTLDETIHVYNPPNGWLQNCNSTPFTVAGVASPDRKAFPVYMAPDAENERGIHAVKVLKDEKSITLDRLIALSHDPYLPGFEGLVTGLADAFDSLSVKNDTLRTTLSAPIELLRNWDLRYSQSSVPTTLAIYWAQHLQQDIAKRIPKRSDQIVIIDYLRRSTGVEKIMALSEAIAELTRDFGKWKQPWGDVNRFQRITENIEPRFDDQMPSLGVASTSSFWGALASFDSKKYQGTRKRYGNYGNSFVAVVEFGKRVRAKSIVTGGSSGDLSSKHFNDQSALYCEGKFKEVWFYPEDLAGHIERTYHPGE